LALQKITIFGLSLAVLAASAWMAGASAQPADTAAPADTSTPAPAPAKHKAHAAKPAAKKGGDAGNSAVEDLNAQSLDAAKAGKTFTPPSTTAAKPAAKPAPAKGAKPAKHHKTKKAAAPAAPADAPK
jgi:hypothetical protein